MKESRPNGDYIRRRRQCLACGHRITTYEFELPSVPQGGNTVAYHRRLMELGVALQQRIDAAIKVLEGSQEHVEKEKDDGNVV